LFTFTECMPCSENSTDFNKDRTHKDKDQAFEDKDYTYKDKDLADKDMTYDLRGLTSTPIPT